MADDFYASDSPQSCYRDPDRDPPQPANGGGKMHWDCETRDWGSIKFDADLGHSDAHYHHSTQTDTNIERITLRQQGEFIGNGHHIDNTIGIYSSHAESRLNDNFRLPASKAVGMHTRIDFSKDTFEISAGRLVGADGAIQNDKTDTGYLSGLGYTHRPNSNWSIGGYVFNLRGHHTVDDHQSLLGVIQYQPRGSDNRYQLHTLSDSEGRLGLWIDAQSRIGDWIQHYGVFSREPGLLWTDVEIDNDERGYYFNSNFKRSYYDFSLGADWSESNLDNGSNEIGEYTITTFLNGGYQVHPYTRLEGGMTVEDQVPQADAASLTSRCYQFDTGIIQDSRFGTTGLKVSKAITYSKAKRTESAQIDISHSWQPQPHLQVKGTLSAEREKEQNALIEELSLGIDLKHEFREYLTWSGKLALHENHGEPPDHAVDVAVTYLWD